jgi:hypothetical protein
VTALFYASTEVRDPSRLLLLVDCLVKLCWRGVGQFLTVFLNDPRVEPERVIIRSSLEPILRAQDPKRGTAQARHG